MGKAKPSELSLMLSTLRKQVLHFDEDRIEAGDVVKWEQWSIEAHVKKDIISGSYSVDLTENSKNSTLVMVTIKGLDEHAVVLKPDHFAIRHFAANTWNKACDYVIFTKTKFGKYAFFVELKTLLHERLASNNVFLFSHDEDKKIAWQFLGANASIDNVIHNIERSQVQRHEPSAVCLTKLVNSKLYDYKRRYIILYKVINCETSTTGPASLSNQKQERISTPNIKCLEMPIHAMKVKSNHSYNLGDFFSVACLER